MSTRSCRPAGEVVEGLDWATDTGKAAAKLGYSAASDLKTKASGDGEHVPA
jgi:hypothetical protein